MYPHEIAFAGFAISVWNATFAAAVVLAYFVFRTLAAGETALTVPALRFLVVVYLSALSAQLFAYAFDANTSLVPAPGTTAWAYYLNPVAGPKTLYGVIVMMPLSVGVATLGCRMPLARALDLWTSPMLTVLSVVRVGCLLEGCCHGVRSNVLGVRFPVGSLVYGKQRAAEWISESAAFSIPVVPTQAIEATALATLAVWTWRRGRAGRGGLFLSAVIAYSVFRFLIEFVRDDPERGIYGPLAVSQWIALGVLAAAFIATRRACATDRNRSRAEGSRVALGSSFLPPR